MGKIAPEKLIAAVPGEGDLDMLVNQDGQEKGGHGPRKGLIKG